MQEFERAATPPSAVLELLRETRRRWKLVVVVVAAAATIAVLWSLLGTPIYQASVTVLPRGDAARFGLLGSLFDMPGLGTTGGATNEALYAKIIVSEEVLDEVIERSWTYRGSKEPVTLYEVYRIDRHGDVAGALQRDRAALVEKLRSGVISMVRDKVSGFMIISVRVPRDPDLAAELANALVDRLDRFNIETSTNRAGRQLHFLESRLQSVRRELSAAEDTMVSFVERNRAFRDSPLLGQRYQRLQREVEATNAVWVELRRQVELTRLEEQRELSTLDILDHAVAPTEPVAPNLKLYLLVAVCLGVVAALIYVEACLLRRTGVL